MADSLPIDSITIPASPTFCEVSEMWHPTPALRWSKDGILEQKWEQRVIHPAFYVKTEWRPVPAEE